MVFNDALRTRHDNRRDLSRRRRLRDPRRAQLEVEVDGTRQANRTKYVREDIGSSADATRVGRAVIQFGRTGKSVVHRDGLPSQSDARAWQQHDISHTLDVPRNVARRASREPRMTTSVSHPSGAALALSTIRRANALAERLEQGARALEAAASALTDIEWHTRIPGDGRTIGVVVHHVATMYPLEIQLAQALAAGKPITEVTSDVVNRLNATHAQENGAVTKDEAIELLRRNSMAAAAAIRALSDEELDRSGTVSLNADAPLTCQFFLEDHAVRHSYHHLARIRAALAAAA
jgi:hypothetical protein